MDESENGNKAIQYWKHVYDVGVRLFENPVHHQDNLKAYIDTVLKTKLLSEIECLSRDGAKNGNTHPCPVTAWLLEGILKATVLCDTTQEEFCIKAQSTLLEATYERSVYDYVYIVKSYLDLLVSVCNVNVGHTVIGLMKSKQVLINTELMPVTFKITGDKFQLRFCSALFQVIEGTHELFSICCSLGYQNNSISATLLNVLSRLIELGKVNVLPMALPLLYLAVDPSFVNENNEVFLKMFCMMPMLLSHQSLLQPKRKEEYISIWNTLKLNLKLPCSCLKNVAKNLCDLKTDSRIEDFVPSEMGHVLSLLPSSDVDLILQDCTTWSLCDKAILLEDLVCVSLKQNGNLIKEEPSEAWLHVRELNQHWNGLIATLVESIKGGTISYGRIKSLHSVLSSISRIIGRLDDERQLVKKYQFIENEFTSILRSVVIHLLEPQQSEISEIAADALIFLLNLPETPNVPSEEIQEFLSQVLQLLSRKVAQSDVFAICPIKIKLIHSLQSLPPGLNPSACLDVFNLVMRNLNLNLQAPLQVVNSVPFLYLSGKASPFQLIADILIPAMLSEQETMQLASLDTVTLLICCVAGTASILRSVTGEERVECSQCSLGTTTSREPLGKVMQVEVHVLKLLDPVFNSSAAVKRKLLTVLPRLSLHMRSLRDLPIIPKLIMLSSDPDVGVRREFANVITTVIFGQVNVLQAAKGYLCEELVLEKKTDAYCPTTTALDLFFTKIEQEINDLLISQQWCEDLQIMLTALINVACFPLREVVLRSLKLLLLFGGNSPLPLPSVSADVSAAHKTSSLALYYAYKPELSQYFGELVVSHYVRFGCPVALTVSNIILFFNGLSKVRFVFASEQFMLPVIITAITKQPNLDQLLYEYAEYVELSLPAIVTRSFHNIYVHIWMNEKEGFFSKAMDVVQSLINTKMKVSELVLHSQKIIIHQFLFNYHINEELVLSGLKSVFDLAGGGIKEQIVALLESRFVGFLLFLVGKFSKEGSAESEKVQAMESLASVLVLMGRRRVTLVSRKVLSTLQEILTLDKVKYASLMCKAWDAFVRTVDSREIGPLLATVVSSVLSLLDQEEKGVVQLLTYLLVEQKSFVAEYLPNLVFVPKQPALTNINDSIRSYISFQNEDIKDRLLREMSLALHETVGVRVEGLKALLATLQNCSVDVQLLINGSDEPDPSITSLWNTLVTSCRDSDKTIAQSAAACLGELGALDPGLLPRKLKPREAWPLSVHDPEFGYLALCYTVRGFQNARTSVDHDAFAIGIQELLKIYSVTEADDNTTWNRFSFCDQSLLRPMLTSRYKVQLPVPSSWPNAIFSSREASSHMGWAALWASKLIARCADAQAVVLFRACEPSFKRDSKVLLFFLPYIVLNVVTQGVEEHSGVLQEIEAVLSWSVKEINSEAPSIPWRLIESCGYPTIQSSMSDSDARACAMTVFLMIDFLYYWTRSYLVKNATPSADHLRKRDLTLVKEFLASIDHVKLAQTNFNMQEYPRAVQFWEDLSQNNTEKLMEYLPILSKAYARYGDLDSVKGALALHGSAPDAEDQLFYHQVSRQMEEVRILYEQLGKNGTLAPSEVEGMVLCYLRLGEPATALSHIQRNIQERPELEPLLTESMSECLMKLGDWSSLDNLLKSEIGSCDGSWYTKLGHITLNLETFDVVAVTDNVVQARTILVDNFADLGMQSGSEHQGYHCLVKLQILNEIEKVRDIITCIQKGEKVRSPLQRLFKHWEAKSSLVQSDSDCLEQLLSMRRTLLTVLLHKVPNETKQIINDELGKCWVKSADIARKAGCFHEAYNYILSAEPYNIPHTFIQKAQLLWEKDDQEESLSTLTRGIATYFSDAETMKSLPPDERLEDRKMTAEAKLLYAIYNEETSNCSSYTNMSHYQDAYDVCRQLEKTQVLLAQCLDRGLSLIEEGEQGDSKACDLRLMMVNHFGKSLMNGCEYIYQTVPRMLTIWLDLGENLSSPDRIRVMSKINKLIQLFTERLPPFILMTALPQLLSRIGHPNREVFLILKTILVTLIRAFPQQCLWAIQTLAKSSVPERSFRYNEVIQDPALRASSVNKLIEDFTSLCDKLNKLTNKKLPQDSITRGIMVSSVVRELPLLLNSEKFSQVIVPITRFCAISLPKSVTSVTHQPFPKHPVTIAGIKNEMTVLPSLQRPRKITFLGSDGKSYDILCKPKDDLRRDARLMEFNNIVNMYLHRDPESRARHLHIKTYVVTPLGESGGLLEWVPNLVGLRPALLQIYKQHGKFVSTRELRKHELQVGDSLEKKRTVYLEKLIPMHPPLFCEWFRLTFPDPAGWYAARQAFTRTTAVMSMVGYILGLGDRHGENILFDSESGETVHVDFNCLFNKGENFDWKERVPFRLTHNMTVAMGPCGVEGAFRKSCEISMRVLRAQGKTLMSVLTPFAYDPFGSWSKNKEIVKQERDQKIAEALGELSDIEKRLNGSLRVKHKNNTFYLSVEGLVRALITEATSVDNLCQMYLGWGAYL